MSVLVLRDPIFDLFWQANKKSNDFEDQVIQCPKLTYLTRNPNKRQTGPYGHIGGSMSYIPKIIH